MSLQPPLEGEREELADGRIGLLVLDVLLDVPALERRAGLVGSSLTAIVSMPAARLAVAAACWSTASS